MSINRFNYEEYFLLYADGELGPLETEMVNHFVKFHPDLKDELDILMDCKLVADIPIFFPKEKLYKQTIWDADNISEIQSNLLLLVDGELEDKFKKELEKNIEENPALQQEWATLQQAKLPLETIAHPHKEPLYKQKEVAKIGWLRWAAVAAAIIGAGWFMLGKNLAGSNVGLTTSTAKNTVATKPPNASIVQPKNTQAVESNDDNDSESSIADNNPTEQNQAENSTTNTQTKEQLAQNVISKPTVSKEIPEENSNISSQDVAFNNNSVTVENDDHASLITNKAVDNVDDMTKVKPSIAKLRAPKLGQLATMRSNVKQSDNTSELQQEAEDDEYVRIAGAKVKKQKIRGVFRNVFRGLGRTFSNSKVEAAPAMAMNNE